MATSIFFLDLAITVIFTAVAGSWSNLWRTGGIGVVLLLGVNGLLARWLFEPIRHFLEGRASFESVERRLTQLPLLTARGVAALAFVVSAFRLSTPFWIDSPIAPLAKPTIADFVTTCIVLTGLLFHLHLFRRQRLPRSGSAPSSSATTAAISACSSAATR